MLNATLPVERESVEVPILSNRTENLEATRWIFFAGDAIPSNEKYEMFDVKGFGGMFLPQIKTLPIENKGMVYRCKLTPLKTRRIGDNKGMLPPGESKMWETSFVQSKSKLVDGQWRDHVVNGFTQSTQQATKEGRFETHTSNHIVYKARYPGDEVRYATRRSLPHGIGGMVEVTAMQGMEDAEGYEAQLFFFPNWVDIRKGLVPLPETLRETEEYFHSRIKAINVEAPYEKRDLYRQIGAAMLKSCDEYRRSSQSNLQKTETSLKAAALKGDNTHAYPASCELQLAFTESRRKDEIVTGEHSATTDLVREMRAERTEGSELKRKELELRERELAIREAELGLRPVANTVFAGGDITSTATPQFRPLTADMLPDENINTGSINASSDPFHQDLGTLADDSTVTELTDAVCGADTAKGTPCQRPAGKCQFHK